MLSEVELPDPSRAEIYCAALWLSLVLNMPEAQQEGVFWSLRWIINNFNGAPEDWALDFDRSTDQIAMLAALMPMSTTWLERLLAQAEVIAGTLNAQVSRDT